MGADLLREHRADWDLRVQLRPRSSTLGAWAGDSTFGYEWTTTAIDAFVANHFSFATQFTPLNYSGYGDLDMFSDSAPYTPKAWFNGLVAEVEKYCGPSTLAIPNPSPSAAGPRRSGRDVAGAADGQVRAGGG